MSWTGVGGKYRYLCCSSTTQESWWKIKGITHLLEDILEDIFHHLQLKLSSSVQSLSRVRLFATPWIAARQASLSITNSRSSLKLTSIESVMPSSHFILCHPLLLLPPVPPSIKVFSNESTLHMPVAPHSPWDPGLARPVGCSGAEFGSDSSWTFRPNPCRQITDSHHPDTQFQAGADSLAPHHQNPINCDCDQLGASPGRGRPALGYGAAGLFWARGSVLEEEKQPL